MRWIQSLNIIMSKKENVWVQFVWIVLNWGSLLSWNFHARDEKINLFGHFIQQNFESKIFIFLQQIVSQSLNSKALQFKYSCKENNWVFFPKEKALSIFYRLTWIFRANTVRFYFRLSLFLEVINIYGILNLMHYSNMCRLYLES
jgi:hypothetical protein